MKHDVTTYNTKKTLAESLKKLMEHKPLSKITVSDLIKDCGVNRNTFYYHFENVDSLLKWILDEEAIKIVQQFDLLLDFDEAVYFTLDYMENNKHILCCAYDSLGRDQLKLFLCNDFTKITRSYIDTLESTNGLSVSVNFKEHLAHFYTEALAGVLTDFITGKSNISREQGLKYISIITKSSIVASLAAADEERVR